MSIPSAQQAPHHTGGCQCGRVRFAVYADPLKIGICHCRMCQKAVAGPFAVLAEIPRQQFAWTRGAPATFQSSTRAVRDFCAACGTPLSYRHPGGPIIELMTGAFDQPARLPPTYAVGTESMLAWLADIAKLPGKTTSANLAAQQAADIVGFQHPDHDTDPDWQPSRPTPEDP
jgi:hypothetical protein